MNVAINYRGQSPDAAAGSYAERLAYLDARDDAIQLCIEDRAAVIERTIREGGIYQGHSILSVLINADDASAVRITQCLATMIKSANRGIDSVAAALFIGSLEAQITTQALQIAAEEINA